MAYQAQIKASIEEKLNIQLPQIDGHNILGYLKHKGAGGNTFIIQSEFLAGSRNIKGGIVVKFANDLTDELRNAHKLEQIIKMRTKEWAKNPPNKPLPDWLPKTIFSPKVLGSHPSRNVIILEFIGGGIPLRKSEFSNEKKYQILGFALGILHGAKSYPTAMELYTPMFRLLETYFPNNLDSLSFWKDVISKSRGGCQFIHGDSHLDNLMYSTTSHSLAWIDALLIPRGDRMDDLTYAISHIIQEDVIALLKDDPNQSAKSILTHILRLSAKTVIPLVLTIYMRTTNLRGLYDTIIPVDFFLGAHLIIRSQLFGESMVANILIALGTQFIIEKPLGTLLGISKV